MASGNHKAILEWLLSRCGAMGITRLANITGLDVVGIPVSAAVRPDSRSLSVAQGKGLTLNAAKISAIMEAAETFHAERIGQRIVCATSFEISKVQLSVDLALLSKIPQFIASDQASIRWIRGWEIVSDQAIWVPFDVVSTAFTVEMTKTHSGLYSSTTGLAGGTSLLYAINHALREVIERDALIVHQRSDEASQFTRRLNLDTIIDPLIVSVLGKFDRGNLSVAIWDVTSDSTIPAFYCVVGPKQNAYSEYPFLAGGVGCHPIKERALLAALTEAAQSRLTVISGAREDLDRRDYFHSALKKTSNQTEITLPQIGERSFDEIKSHAVFSLRSQISLMARQLAELGLPQIIVVNLTKPNIGIPIVKVIVPGLEVGLSCSDSVSGTAMSRKSATI